MPITKHCKFIELAPVLIEYIKIIKAIETAREGFIPSLYIELDKRRVICHDKILTIVNKTREDKEFEYALAKYVMDILNI